MREQNVLLDADLAAMYGVAVKVLNQAVSRNAARFPPDFMFRLTALEVDSLRSQLVTSKGGRGGRRYLPLAFTEEGVAMLSGVLRSERAVLVNIEIMRAFVRFRIVAGEQRDLVERINALEQKYDGQFKEIFDVIDEMMFPAVDRRPIGFQPEEP